MAVSLISLMLIVGTLLPAVAKAGIVADFLNAISISIHGNVAEAETVSGTGNSQTMPLPKATLNGSDALDNDALDNTIVDDSAVASGLGVSGTMYRPATTTISIHVVRDGETLTQIAKMYEVTPNTILWANDLPKGAKLKVGQTLTILPVPGVIHTVGKGETLASIAKKFDGDVAEIASFNGIDDGPLAIGTEVIIPNGEIAEPTPAPTKKPSVAAGVGKLIKTTISAGYYSAPMASYIKTQGIHDTNGVDLAPPCRCAGDPILAAADGDVIVAKGSGYNGGFGSYVVIQHDNGSQTLYAHQSQVLVSVGQHVVKGQQIGKVGNTGRVSGPTGYHLHFEIRNGIRNPF